MRGDSATIGLIIPDTAPGALEEHRRLLPNGVDAIAAHLPSHAGEVTIEALTRMSADGRIEHAADRLRRRGADCVLFACTTTSLVRGAEWDKRIVERVEHATGLPAATSASAASWAFEALRSRRIALVTPHPPELDSAERNFFERAGFEITVIGGVENLLDSEIDRLTPSDLAWHADLVDLDDADALFVSCPGWRVLDTVSHLEKVHRRSVVTGVQAGSWAALRLLGIPDPVFGFGSLLRISQLPERTRLLHHITAPEFSDPSWHAPAASGLLAL